MQSYYENYLLWKNSTALSDAERKELEKIEGNNDEIKSRFNSYLSFGTGGLRSTMKTGMNAMNVHTVAYATQGLANLINKENRSSDGVAVGYDCRNNSKEFAIASACVLAANGIKVYLFDGVRPTPELSYAVRKLGCVAGINITASHNPKQYNGYKAYWDDGAQLPPEHADTVIAEMAKLDIFKDVRTTDYEKAVADGKIKLIGKEIDESYLDCVKAQSINPNAIKAVADDLKIVYTPLHGVGYKLVPEILHRMSLKHLYTVDEQSVPDGNFPTLVKPNPEYPESFKLGIALADKVGSDLVIATDPDADRVGVATRKADGSFMTITGNQMGALLLDYIITAFRETGTMPKDPYAIKSIVSTELVTKICEVNNIKLYNVLTGFKFIGEVIKKHEETGEGSFIFGFEESYGYLKGTYARDKDSVVATMLICEMTAYYKAKNMTLADALDSLYKRYSFSSELTSELYIEGVDGPEKIAGIMDRLRNDMPKSFGEYKVVTVGDYLAETITDLESGKISPTGLSKSNVMYFGLDNSDVVVARPSGTEPKIKFYYLVSASEKKEADAKIALYKSVIDSYTK